MIMEKISERLADRSGRQMGTQTHVDINRWIDLEASRDVLVIIRCELRALRKQYTNPQ